MSDKRQQPRLPCPVRWLLVRGCGRTAGALALDADDNPPAMMPSPLRPWAHTTPCSVTVSVNARGDYGNNVSDWAEFEVPEVLALLRAPPDAVPPSTTRRAGDGDGHGDCDGEHNPGARSRVGPLKQLVFAQLQSGRARQMFIHDLHVPPPHMGVM